MSKPAAHGKSFDLRTTQKWVQHVITHPQGVSAALDSNESRELLGIGPDDLVKAVLPSKNLSSHERITIYSNMIVWRLVECLAGDFSAVKYAVGDDAWEQIARGFLARHPSEHYSLNRLGAKFPAFLRDEIDGIKEYYHAGCCDEHAESETRASKAKHAKPSENAAMDRRGISLPSAGEGRIKVLLKVALKNRQVLSEIAQLEWALQEVFDEQRAEPLTRVQLMAVPQDKWPELRVRFVPAFRLMAFTHPANAYLQGVRDERKVRLPRPRASWVYVYRKNFKVFREDLDLPRYTILSSLLQSETVGDTLEKVANLPNVKWELLAKKVGAWFNDWAAKGLFAAVELPGENNI